MNEEVNTYSFPTKNIFAKAACYLPAVMENQLTYNKKELFRATVDPDIIKGTVSYMTIR